MKRQVRTNVFETNSSSMHSLVITKNEDKYSSEEIMNGICLSDDENTNKEDCVWEIWDEDKLYFGRSPFKVLSSFKDKWLYALASLVREYNDEVYKKLEKIAMQNITGLEKIKLPQIIRSFPNKENVKNYNSDYTKEYGKTESELIAYLKEKEIELELDNEIYYWENDYGNWSFYVPYTGNVDEDILSGFLKEENITLEDFLLNKKYIVIQDGDEYCIWNKLKETGLVDYNNIDYEY